MKNHIKKIVKLFHLVTNLEYLRALFAGIPAAIEHEKLFAITGSLQTIVDIGANRGQFSVVARKHNSNAEIYAFEPLAKPFNTLMGRFSGDDKFHGHNLCLGNSEGEIAFNVAAKSDSSSVLLVSTNHANRHNDARVSETTLVSICRLDDIFSNMVIKRPALLKLDVQGFELEVLKGGWMALDKFDFIYVECAFEELYKNQALVGDVIEYMKDRGFSLCSFVNLYYSKPGVSSEADVLFNSSQH